MPLPEYKQLVDEAKREIKEIDPAELKRMQEQKQDFTLIDVREPDEVAEGAIAGAKPLPRGQLEHKIDTITLYLGKRRSDHLINEVISSRPRRIIMNPGAENPELARRAAAEAIEVVEGCTLVMLRTGTF